MDPLVGRVLGPYELQARLGAGGMGTVYRAVHRRLRQQRAVKVLPSSLAADPTFVQRFEREARLAAELRHPNIVVVHDVDEDAGVNYIAMELLEGRSLRDLIREEAPIAIERALSLLDQLASALDFAHARGVVHRDVKPANVFVSSTASPNGGPGAGLTDHLTLVDFGIARAADGTVLTGAGVVGTPDYMAPEMLRGEGAGESADLYALGIVAYELLTGRTPFRGTTTPAAIMYAHVHTPPPPLRSLQPELPQALEDVVARQLSKHPNERYSSAGSFVYALRMAAGAPRSSAVDRDAPVLDGIRATLASGDWRAALRDFELLSQPSAPSALELRRQAEALRQREQPSTPTPPPAPPTPTRVPPTPTVDEGPIGREMPDEGIAHVPEGAPVSHQQRPPTSGAHYPAAYPRYGVFDFSVPTGSWLHSVEHGAIAVLYNCPQGCQEIAQQLRNLYPKMPLGRNARGGQPRVLIFPYTDMDIRIAVVTWRWLLELDRVDEAKIIQFAEEHLDRSWECNQSTRVCPFP